VSGGRGLAIVLAVAAVACVGGAFLTGPAESSSNVDGAAATPLWSARRVPQPIVDAVGAQRLQSALDAQVGASSSCFVVDEGGAPLAARAIDLPVIPASTQKLLTSAAALAVLGPDTRLVTRAAAPSAPDNGALERLWLVGGGDPLLTTPEFQALREQVPELRGTPTTSLAALADAIVAAGVKRIPGGIVADDSRYETLRYLPTWKDSYRTEGQVGPLGALTVNGGFRAVRPPEPVDDPALYAASELARLLEDRGVSVGPISSGTATAGAVDIANIESPPMRDLVGEVIRASDNLGAELLTREIGLQQAKQGTTAAGTQAIVATLTELGLPTANIVLVDGSGLDRGDRSTCQLLAATLNLGADAQFQALWDGLAVAGTSGTLVDELDGSALDGKLRAKTGSLDGVTGLVGIVDVGRPLRFAFVANGEFTERGGIELRSRIATIIAAFPDAPPADTLVPQPSSASDS
jgi:D-alanyl-D-alanine carboxypeptidase/D-alanyl-D-alanine-endopeptidase (penicillin-binding protein 4)